MATYKKIFQLSGVEVKIPRLDPRKLSFSMTQIPPYWWKNESSTVRPRRYIRRLYGALGYYHHGFRAVGDKITINRRFFEFEPEDLGWPCVCNVFLIIEKHDDGRVFLRMDIFKEIDVVPTYRMKIREEITTQFSFSVPGSTKRIYIAFEEIESLVDAEYSFG